MTFVAFTLYLKFFVPEGVILSKLNWDPNRTTPREAFDRRWSDVVVAARATVETAIADTTILSEEPGLPARTLKRARIRSASDHPMLLLYDRNDTGGVLQPGDEIDVRGVYAWNTSGGTVRAVRADSSAFGAEIAEGEAE